ncbi:hypothetical protein Rhow_008767 [Rhodococcus wratislaviensis]|uniref:Uncharacterized protein n=1 Tax=Rhodococcus wratislaviensis TaxID=44752 RepID=A0A402CKZ4_RHOWR|nr:hypothetical protein Rhow_008767 [Rhodococcus wratislaviensis]
MTGSLGPASHPTGPDSRPTLHETTARAPAGLRDQDALSGR